MIVGRMRVPAALGRIYLVLAGLCDTVTGVLLLVSPNWVLSVLGLSPVGSASQFLRWVGAFVLAMGLLYLYPFLLAVSRRRDRLVVVVESTTLVRTVVATFVVVSMVQGRLELGWWIVALSDASMALFQLILLAVGSLDES